MNYRVSLSNIAFLSITNEFFERITYSFLYKSVQTLLKFIQSPQLIIILSDRYRFNFKKEIISNTYTAPHQSIHELILDLEYLIVLFEAIQTLS